MYGLIILGNSKEKYNLIRDSCNKNIITYTEFTGSCNDKCGIIGLQIHLQYVPSKRKMYRKKIYVNKNCEEYYRKDKKFVKQLFKVVGIETFYINKNVFTEIFNVHQY